MKKRLDILVFEKGFAESREKALSVFINGLDANRDGVAEIGGVSDIQLGLKTYATSGN